MHHSCFMLFALGVTRVVANMWNCTSSMGGCTANCCSPNYADLQCCSDDECHGTTPRGKIIQGACRAVDYCDGGPPVMWNRCVVDQCETDNDCLYHEACLGGGGNAYGAKGCYPSTCKIDADCTAGPSGKCLVFQEAGGFTNCAGPSARACAYSNSTCGEAPCPNGGVCYWDGKPTCGPPPRPPLPTPSTPPPQPSPPTPPPPTPKPKIGYDCLPRDCCKVCTQCCNTTLANLGPDACSACAHENCPHNSTIAIAM